MLNTSKDAGQGQQQTTTHVVPSSLAESDLKADSQLSLSEEQQRLSQAATTQQTTSSAAETGWDEILSSLPTADILDGFPAEDTSESAQHEGSALPDSSTTARTTSLGAEQHTTLSAPTAEATLVANQPTTVPVSQSPTLQVQDDVTIVQPDVLLGSLYVDMQHLYAAVGIGNELGRDELEGLIGNAYERNVFSDRINTWGPNQHPERDRVLHEWADRGFTQDELRNAMQQMSTIDLSQNSDMAAVYNIGQRLLQDARNADGQHYVTQSNSRVSPFELGDVTNPDDRIRPGADPGRTSMSDGRLQAREFLALGIANPQLIYGGSEYIVHDARSPETLGEEILRGVSVTGSVGAERESGIYTTSGALGVNTDLYTVGNWFVNVINQPPVFRDEILRTLGMFGGGDQGPTRVPFALRGQPFETGLE